MKHKPEYKKNLIEFKKKLIQSNINIRIKKYILVKINNKKYDDADKYIDIESGLIGPFIFLRISAEKKIEKRREFIMKNKYVEKIRSLKNITRSESFKIVKEMDMEYIRMFEKYYNCFIELFLDINNYVDNEYVEYITSNNYVQEYFGLDHLSGMGIFLRNKYIYPNNNENIKKIFSNDGNFRHEDNKSTLVIFGYRYYKMGIFNVFNNS